MAKLTVGVVKGILISIIVVTILFTLLNDTAADVGEPAGNLTLELNSSNHCPSGTESDCYGYYTWPLVSFFEKKGILLLAFIAGVVLMVITAFFKGK